MDFASDTLIGPLAGIATSALWTATLLFFAAAGSRIGPTVVNASRIMLAIVLHAITFRLLSGMWFPDVAGNQILLLALSGVVGLSIGDQALLTSLVYIGPRVAALVMTTAPLFATLFGWLALGETLPPLAWLGMAMTVGGVAWVVLERQPSATEQARASWGAGLMLAFVAAACQAGGLLLSKQGMGHGSLPAEQHLDPQAATLVRMVFAGLGMVPIVAGRFYRERKRRAAGLSSGLCGSRGTGFLLAGCGAIVGPFLGVWMSLVASDRAPLGVAQTLCSLPPVFILPFMVFIHGERIGVRAVVGAIVAVGGSALLFL